MLNLPAEIYEPGDDSYLLAEQVAKNAEGICLDMGTGTGIQAVAAAKKCPVVIAADINKAAIAYAEKTIMNKKIHFFTSDLFSGLEEKREEILRIIGKKDLRFDTIIFNPPYLPEEKGQAHIALDGGKQGFEVLGRFLESAGRYLEEHGRILIVFSSLTQQDMVDSLLAKHGFDKLTIATQRLFFEELYVYKATKKRQEAIE